MITVCCINCKVQFQAFACHHRRFCSTNCNYEYKRNDPNQCNWNKLRVWDKRAREKRSLATSGSKNGNWKGGLPKCGTCGKELRNRKAKNCKKHRSIEKWLRGEEHPFWKGGVTPERKKVEKSEEYRMWRESVFERDNYTCQMCGARSKKDYSVILNADHIKPFSLYKDLRFSLENGRTLCVDCHKKTSTYGLKLVYQEIRQI